MSEARDKATPFKNAGNAAFKKKDWKTAIEQYTQAIAADPSWEVPYSNRSQAYFQLKQYENATNDGKLCIRANPEYVKGFHRTCNALIKLGKYMEAMKVLEQAYKNGHRANKDLMKMHEKVQPKFEAAKAQHDAALPLKEKLKAAGNKFFKSGEYPQALEKYNEALKHCKKPDDMKLIVSLHCNRALCWQQQSAFQQVIACCNEALELDPENAKALMRRSSAFEGMEKYRLALQDVRKVLLRHPTMSVANRAQHRLSSAVRRLKAAKAGQY